MNPGHRAGRGVVLFLTALALTDCEKGCLASWLSTHGVGGSSPGGSSGTDATGRGLDLTGTDCSDGLARCIEGQVQVSRTAHLPARTGQGNEPRGCPWVVAGHCGVDCAVSGIEVAAASDAIALEQLCRPSESVERAALPTDPRRGEICAASRIDCVDGVVGLCDAPGATVRALGVCVHGCADGISVEPEDILTSDGVAAILCRRDHAERR